MAQLQITDDLILKVHTGPDGQVWFLDGDRPPENSGVLVEPFLSSPQVRKAEKVRILGVPENASLAISLYNLKNGRLNSLEVCSPLACETSARREKPEHVLFDMRKWTMHHASCGGWHEFQDLDYPSYAIADALRTGATPGHTARFLKDHPAWPALAGIPHLFPIGICGLISAILDPRFFIDQDDPDRLSKLEAFLGLDPKIAAVGGKTDSPTKQHNRYRLLLDCWKNDDPGQQAASGSPELFVWRAYYAAGGGWKGDLRASQRFVHYLRHTWLNALYPHRKGEPLFVPEHFFSDKDIVKWYNRTKRKS
jgi:hypothetical protein